MFLLGTTTYIVYEELHVSKSWIETKAGERVQCAALLHLSSSIPQPSASASQSLRRAAVRFRASKRRRVASAFGMNGARLECGTQQRRGRQARAAACIVVPPACPRPNATPPLPIDEGSRGCDYFPRLRIRRHNLTNIAAVWLVPLAIFFARTLSWYIDIGSGQATPIRLVHSIRQSISLIYGIFPKRCTYVF